MDIPGMALLADSSGRVLFDMPDDPVQRRTLTAAAQKQGPLLARGCVIRMEGRKLRVRLGPTGTLDVPKEQLVFGLLAPYVSDKEWQDDEDHEDEGESKPGDVQVV